MMRDTDGRSHKEMEGAPAVGNHLSEEGTKRRGPLRCAWFSCTNMAAVIDNDVPYCGSCYLERWKRR